MDKQVFEIDGERFDDMGGFFEEFSRVVIPDTWWGRNLDAFLDVLRGGMGTPDEGFVLVWKNSALSRERLGYEGTAKLLEKGLQDYSRGLSYDEFTRYMRRIRWINTFKRLLGHRYSYIASIEEIQATYRYYEQEIAQAQQHQGETIFDWIMDCFSDVPEIEVRLE